MRNYPSVAIDLKYIVGGISPDVSFRISGQSVDLSLQAGIVSRIPKPNTISTNASIWAASIGGVNTVNQYVEFMAAAGLKAVIIEDNPQYGFVSKSAKRASVKYGIKSISVLAIKQ